MTATKKLMGLIAAVGLLVFFQNCGAAKQTQDSPLDDQVSKIDQNPQGDPAPLDDDAVVLSTLNLVREADADQDIAVKVEECQRVLGSQRVDCVEEMLVLYYKRLEKRGFTVSRGGGCFLATLAQPRKLVLIDSTCDTRLMELGQISLHLDECLPRNPVDAARPLEISSILPFTVGRNFQRAVARIDYPNSNKKLLELIRRHPRGETFKEACGKELKVQKIGLNQTVVPRE